MKSTTLIIQLVLTCIGHNVYSQGTENNCGSVLNLDSVISMYKINGQPLADIDFNKPLNPEWTQTDFLLLKLILEESNPNIYRYADKSTMDSLFDASLCDLNDSTYYRDFVKDVARVLNVMACGHSGWTHSKDYQSYRSESMKFFPLEIRSIDNRYFITRNNSADSTIKEGTEILSIDGVKPVSINETLRNFMYRDGKSIPNAETEISKYFSNAYSNFINDPDTFSLLIKTDTSKTRQLQLSAQSKNSIDSISQARYGNKQGLGKPLLFEIDTAISTAKYTIKWFRNEYIEQNGQNFNSFTDSVFQTLQTNQIENLIIDLRGNVGGWTANGKKLFSYFIKDPIPYIRKVELTKLDSFSFQPLILSNQGLSDTMKFELNENELYEWTNYPNLIAYPASKNQFNGTIYVLIDEESRSCSSIFSAMMKNHTNAVFIGEECGAAQCGSGGMVIATILPYTGIVIFSSTAKYYTNVLDPSNTRGVNVDYSIKPSIPTFLNRNDKAIELTYDLIRKNGK